MAISNADSRGGLARLAEEQAALRRVATLVACGAPPDELFAAVTGEVGQLLAVDRASLGHYESDAKVTFLVAWSPAGFYSPPASHWALEGRNVATLVAQTGRPARIDGFGDDSGPMGFAARERGLRSQVGAPIIVDGRIWGVMGAGSVVEQRLPPETEARLASFTDLVATAIANAESRGGLARLAEEQAALRRVATLVARGVPPEELFAAVGEEVGRLLSVDIAGMGRYGSDGTLAALPGWSRAGDTLPATGSTLAVEGKNVPTLVAQTGSPARIDGHGDASGPLGAVFREVGIHSAVGTPVVVEGRLWGVMSVGSTQEQPLPADTEARLAGFTDLLGTAIANADSRAELNASRARIVAAADEARRRIERDLHDGAQQRLVSLGLQLRTVQSAMPPELGELDSELSRVTEGLASVVDELREIARGIHPAILAHGGIGPVLKTLARRSPIPVQLDVRADARLPQRVEVATYYVVSEALTNAAKHAHASVIKVEVETVDGALRVRVRDDGTGGADPSRGSGLVGLKDRVETLGGKITVQSQHRAGTSVDVELPIEV
jgi:signal transduction histidine kinase